MCNGNLRLPPATVGNIGDFEKAFFNSAFTHGRDNLTRFPGAHLGLWTHLAALTTAPPATFWKQALIPTKSTISSLLRQ